VDGSEERLAQQLNEHVSGGMCGKTGECFVEKVDALMSESHSSTERRERPCLSFPL
jgi:hypothetical protein